jgi:hypothetical protein
MTTGRIMKLQTISIVFLAVVMGALAAFAGDADPAAVAPSASTNPATFTIHGQVKISANLDFQKEDLSRVIVYLDSDPTLDGFPISADRPTVAQLNKQFAPNFLAIPRGTEVEFPNWDHFSHNVFSRSSAAPAFDLDRYPFGESKSRKFDNAGVIQIFCNIHPYMKALIFVTPNKFFARADDSGNFTLPEVPAGHYNVVAWQERCGKQQQAIDVTATSPDIAFTLSEDRQSILANDPPRHANGYGVDRGLGVKREVLNLPVVEDAHPAPTTEPCPNCQ